MEWFIGGWEKVGLVALSTAAMYASVLIGVRLGGRRTVSQMSAFDFVVTIALGSVTANAALMPRPSVVQALSAIATFLALQLSLGWARRRWRQVERLADFAPLTVVRSGHVDDSVLRTTQMTLEELRSKLRSRGSFRLDEVRLAILEPDGGISVLNESIEPDPV